MDDGVAAERGSNSKRHWLQRRAESWRPPCDLHGHEDLWLRPPSAWQQFLLYRFCQTRLQGLFGGGFSAGKGRPPWRVKLHP